MLLAVIAAETRVVQSNSEVKVTAVIAAVQVASRKGRLCLLQAQAKKDMGSICTLSLKKRHPTKSSTARDALMYIGGIHHWRFDVSIKTKPILFILNKDRGSSERNM